MAPNCLVHGVHTGRGSQPGEDVGQVAFDGGLADPEFTGDLLIGHRAGHRVQYLLFPGGRSWCEGGGLRRAGGLGTRTGDRFVAANRQDATASLLVAENAGVQASPGGSAECGVCSLPDPRLPRKRLQGLHYHLFKLLASGEEISNHPTGGWRPQVPYLNLLYGRDRQKSMQNAGRDPMGFRYQMLENIRHDLAARCLDRASSPLWKVISRPAFETAMSDRVTAEERAPKARSIYAAATLFEYEAFRDA